ncbi:MAG TPA: hypothetical protein VL978_12535 [Puia sp.]|nr:hypothetical protein [Puia sp.]
MMDEYSGGRREFMLRMALLAGSSLVGGGIVLGEGHGGMRGNGTGGRRWSREGWLAQNQDGIGDKIKKPPRVEAFDIEG